VSESFRISLWAQGFALALLVGGVFAPVVSFDFLRWDDDIAVTQNELIQADFSAELVERWFQSDQALRFKPVHWVSGWLLFQAFGLNPGAWHVFNLLLHGAVSVGFFLVLRQGFRWADRDSPHASLDGVAWFAAAIWAVHPLRVEPVAWVTASTYAMATGWLILSFACYLRAHSPGKAKPDFRFLVGAWMAAVMAYGTYPVTVSYALLLVVVDWGWFRRLPRWGSAEFGWWAGKIAAFAAPAVFALGATVWVRFFDAGIFTEAPDLARVGIGERVLTALAMVAALAGRLFWFPDLTPNVPPMALTAGSMLLLVGLAAITLVVSAWVWRRRVQAPTLAVGWFAYLAIAIPCLGLTERPAWPVDRYSYLAHVVLMGGLAAALGMRYARFTSGNRGVALGVVLIMGLAWGSRQQLSMWRDSDTFFAALTEHPDFGDNVRQDGHVLLLWSRHAGAHDDEKALNERREQALQMYLGGIRSALATADYAEAVSLMTHIQHHFNATAEMYREQGAWLIELERWNEAAHALAIAGEMKPADERTQELLGLIPPP